MLPASCGLGAPCWMRLRGLKIWCRWTGRMAGPWLWTATETSSAPPRAVTVTGASSAPCWTALPTRFESAWLTRAPSHDPCNRPDAANRNAAVRVVRPRLLDCLPADLAEVSVDARQRDARAEPRPGKVE